MVGNCCLVNLICYSRAFVVLFFLVLVNLLLHERICPIYSYCFLVHVCACEAFAADLFIIVSSHTVLFDLSH